MVNFTEIKSCYEVFEPIIFERFKINKSASRWISPYTLGWDFISDFTPIEMMTWQALRCYGHAPFYPQYPVGKYFLDFGNPIVKVGIECDGKNFHTDKKKDAKRDSELMELGWTIYRISGADCNRIIELEEDEIRELDNSKEYFFTTIEGLIESLAAVYFDQYIFGECMDIVNMVIKCLDNRVSIKTDDFYTTLYNFQSNYLNKYLKTA